MDRAAAVLILLGTLVTLVLSLLALFAMAPIFCSCLASLMYTLFLFIVHEKSGVHHAQEFENRFWTIFAILFSTALFFAKDSPIAFGRWSPSLGFVAVAVSGYGMHTWDRYKHRIEISRQISLRRGVSAAQSLVRLRSMGIPIEDQLAKINECLAEIDQLLVPSTINNIINPRLVLKKEREIISVFEEAEPKALNFIIQHARMGLLFYKIKDHPRIFSGQHRTELVELLAVTRISVLTVISRVIVLHALQIMKLPANRKAEYWVRNIILNTRQDDLSDLKTLTDAKGDFFSMNKLIFEDIRSEMVRQDILAHIRKEANVQQAHMAMGTKRSKERRKKAWRKVLSDVDDTLTCSGGSYPAGIDKRFGKKVVYPGVLAFYRELDLGTKGPEEWPANTVGNLVFLSARPHLYKDVSEKQNFAKFEKLRMRGEDGRGGMHTVPSLLPGDIASGRDYIVNNDMEPLALKKFENFKQYVTIYPEFTHIFICDNGQGDVRAGELMFDAFPQHLEALYVHKVQDIDKTHGFDAERWRRKGLNPCFFRTYPDAALDAVQRELPLIRTTGLLRVCQDALKDFYLITTKQWPSQAHKSNRRDELNQALWRCNNYLISYGLDPVPLIEAEQEWMVGEKVRTPYGGATVVSFDPIFDMYEIEIDWRALDVQVAEYEQEKKAAEQKKKAAIKPKLSRGASEVSAIPPALETVVEIEESEDENVVSELESVAETVDDKEADSPEESRPKPLKDADESSIPKESKDFSNSTKSQTLADTPSPTDESDTGEETVTASSDDVDRVDRIASADDNGSSNEGNSSHVYARVKGSCITKFTPPVLPIIPKDKGKGTLFSFWGATDDAPRTKKKVFKAGDKCTTAYGPGTVVEYRDESNIVVLDMIGWKARAYLQEDSVKLISKGLLGALLSPFSSGEVTDGASSSRRAKKEIEFPEGKELETPFGKGVIVQPLNPTANKPKQEAKGKRKGKDIVANAKSPAVSKPQQDFKGTLKEGFSPPNSTDEGNWTTLGIGLKTWTLADGSHPVLYSTPETVREWQQKIDGKSMGTNLLSAFGTLVSGTIRRIRAPPEKKKSSVEEVPSPVFEQYCKLGAAVTTPFGDGQVSHFRENDGFYSVELTNWELADGSHPSAFLQAGSLSHCITKGCHEGYPVLTSLGLSGILASVEPTTGVHIVTIPSVSMVCYLRPKDVIRPLKAAVGEDVLTAYGEGKVRKYRKADDMYEISLGWDGSILYAKGETFDRVADSTQDGSGSGGMSDWLFRFLFFSSQPDKQRSRSNSVASIASIGTRSQSGRNLA